MWYLSDKQLLRLVNESVGADYEYRESKHGSAILKINEKRKI